KRRWGSFQQDQYVLAVDKVRYVGDEIAAVAAVDDAIDEEALGPLDAGYEVAAVAACADAIAEGALGLIDGDYEELPAVFDAVEAMEPGAPLIHDDKPGNVAVHLQIHRQRTP